jgi:uncharacterized Zn finger protein
MINDNVPDDSNLAQCCSCGFVDDWDEIPKGRCQFTEDTLTECPECGDVDGFADYDPANTDRQQRIADKVAKANGSRN